jgi:hypothetical protein
VALTGKPRPAMSGHLSGQVRRRERRPERGRDERVVPLVDAEFLDERLPISRLVIVDAGHFVWEEAPIKYASIILDLDYLKGESGAR